MREFGLSRLPLKLVQALEPRSDRAANLRSVEFSAENFQRLTGRNFFRRTGFFGLEDSRPKVFTKRAAFEGRAIAMGLEDVVFGDL